jgi:hypothetical protein
VGAGAVTRTWYRVAVAEPAGGPARVVAAAGEHLGVAVAAAVRASRGAFAIAAELAPDADIPLGESLGKSSVVDVAAPCEAPAFAWPAGVLPRLSRASEAAAVRRGWVERPHRELFVIEAQTEAAQLTDVFLGLLERLPRADNLEVRLMDHFEDAGRADVWLTSRVDGRRIVRVLDDLDVDLLANGHVELSIYARAQRATLRLTEHKTVVWLAHERALAAEIARWLGELGVPQVDALVTVKDVPHYHYRPAASRDRGKLGEELFRQRLRRVDRVKPPARAG